jgi:hypothetical protein
MSDDAKTPAPAGRSWLDRAMAIVGVVCALLLGVELLVPKPATPHLPWERWVAFFGFFGFVSYSFIVYAGRALRTLVMRREDYYDE